MVFSSSKFAPSGPRTNIDSTTGDSTFNNTDAGFVGLNEGTAPLTVG